MTAAPGPVGQPSAGRTANQLLLWTGPSLRFSAIWRSLQLALRYSKDLATCPESLCLKLAPGSGGASEF